MSRNAIENTRLMLTANITIWFIHRFILLSCCHGMAENSPKTKNKMNSTNVQFPINSNKYRISSARPPPTPLSSQNHRDRARHPPSTLCVAALQLAFYWLWLHCVGSFAFDEWWKNMLAKHRFDYSIHGNASEPKHGTWASSINDFFTSFGTFCFHPFWNDSVQFHQRRV